MLRTMGNSRDYQRSHYVLMVVLAVVLLVTQLIETWTIQGDSVDLGNQDSDVYRPWKHLCSHRSPTGSQVVWCLQWGTI